MDKKHNVKSNYVSLHLHTQSNNNVLCLICVHVCVYMYTVHFSLPPFLSLSIRVSVMSYNVSLLYDCEQLMWKILSHFYKIIIRTWQNTTTISEHLLSPQFMYAIWYIMLKVSLPIVYTVKLNFMFDTISIWFNLILQQNWKTIQILSSSVFSKLNCALFKIWYFKNVCIWPRRENRSFLNYIAFSVDKYWWSSAILKHQCRYTEQQTV